VTYSIEEEAEVAEDEEVKVESSVDSPSVLF